jgi:hypothetical protein
MKNTYPEVIMSLDALASDLENQGLTKEASDIDMVSNTIEKEAAQSGELVKSFSRYVESLKHVPGYLHNSKGFLSGNLKEYFAKLQKKFGEKANPIVASNDKAIAFMAKVNEDLLKGVIKDSENLLTIWKNADAKEKNKGFKYAYSLKGKDEVSILESFGRFKENMGIMPKRLEGFKVIVESLKKNVRAYVKGLSDDTDGSYSMIKLVDDIAANLKKIDTQALDATLKQVQETEKVWRNAEFDLAKADSSSAIQS